MAVIARFRWDVSIAREFYSWVWLSTQGCHIRGLIDMSTQSNVYFLPVKTSC